MKVILLIFIFALPYIVHSDWFQLDDVGLEISEESGMEYSSSCEILNADTARDYCKSSDNRSASFVATIRCKGNYYLGMNDVSGYMNCEKLQRFNPKLTTKFKVPPNTLLETSAGAPGFVVGLPKSHNNCRYTKKDILSVPTTIPSCTILPRICIADIKCRRAGKHWLEFLGRGFEQQITCRAKQVNAEQWKCPTIDICLRDYNVKVQPSYDETSTSTIGACMLFLQC